MALNMELIWLEDFLALSDMANFSRAAELRNVTQPAFSRRIRALEEWVGAGLFERHSNGARLTEAGMAFRPGAEDLLRRINQLCAETREVGKAQASTLHFAATHALSFTFFPGWIRGLEPPGAISLVSDSMQACEQVMLQGEAQFLLCYYHDEVLGRFDPAHFLSVCVGKDRLALLSAPDADGKALWQISGADGPVNYLAYGAESGLGRIVGLKQSRSESLASLRPVVTSQLAATLQSMARLGRGLAWLPWSVAMDDIADGKLVRASHPSTDIELEIRLFRPRARQSAAAEQFWARLKDAKQGGVA